METNNSTLENIYAYNDKDEIIYIGDVPYSENGIKKTYLCLGCKRQMQAVKAKKRKEHFKHHVTKRSSVISCSYKDETYRHKLAKEIIQRLKKVKVPPVLKFDPKNKSTYVMRIREAQFIQAKSVLIEKSIYEDLNGNIQIGNKPEGEISIHFTPDAIILDEQNTPVLLVEFVATHKPDLEKIRKIKRIGINAIQILVPKSSPQEIEKAIIKTITNTKWIFNDEEYQTIYVSNADTDTQSISEIDNEQRQLFEEGFKCRSAEIGDLIRAINKVLESESYRATASHLRQEIRRVEENKKREQYRLEELREQHRKRGIATHSTRRTAIEEKIAIMEERYLRKRAEIEQLTSKAKIDIERAELGKPGTSRTSSDIQRDIRREEEEIEHLKQQDSDWEETIRRSEETLQFSFNGEVNQLTDRFTREEGFIEIDAERERTAMGIDAAEDERKRNDLEEKYRKRRNDLPGLISEAAKRIEQLPGEFKAKLEAGREQLHQTYSTRSDSTGGRIAEEYRKLHVFRDAIKNYKHAWSKNRRATEGNT